jgi:hypothetical protein
MNVEFLVKNSWPFSVDVQINGRQLIPLQTGEEKYILLRYKDTISVFKEGRLCSESVVIDNFSKRNIFLSSLTFTDLGDQLYINSYAVIPSVTVFNHFNFPINIYINYEKAAVLYPRDTNFKFSYLAQKTKSSIYLDNDQNGFKLSDTVGFSTIDKNSPQVFGTLTDKYLRQIHVGKILLE